MKFFQYIFWVIFLSFFLTPAQIKIEPIRTIEESVENIFYGIRDLTVSEDKWIYFVNFKANTVSKFDWNGKFVKKTGHRGQGPGDFNSPTGIDYFEGKLYIYDSRNYRIVVMDKDLNLLEIIKSDLKEFYVHNFNVTMNMNFIGTVIPGIKGNDLNFIRSINKEGKKVSSFFNKIPYWETVRELSYGSYQILCGYSFLKLAINGKRDKIVFTQVTPANPAIFYIYTTSGKLLNKFLLPLNREYKFPAPVMNEPKDDECFSQFYSIHFFGNNIITQYYLSSVSEGKRTTTTRLLIIDPSGKILAEKVNPEGEEGQIFHITDDHFMVSMTMADDEAAINISKIKLL